MLFFFSSLTHIILAEKQIYQILFAKYTFNEGKQFFLSFSTTITTWRKLCENIKLTKLLLFSPSIFPFVSLQFTNYMIFWCWFMSAWTFKRFGNTWKMCLMQAAKIKPVVEDKKQRFRFSNCSRGWLNWERPGTLTLCRLNEIIQRAIWVFPYLNRIHMSPNSHAKENENVKMSSFPSIFRPKFRTK